MDNTPKYHGSLVAFEGPSDAVFTQLQLLPISSQILALPSLDCYVDTGIYSKKFSPRSYIRQIHEAVALRHKEATEFLEQATPDSKRLVFMQGGAASAVARCIAGISENETQGDTRRAESIFKDIVRDGVDTLINDGHLPTEKNVTPTEDEVQQDQIESAEDSTVPEDPTIKAMKAADALDLETANLQPASGLDFTILSRPRSMSVPAYGYSNGFNRESAMSIIGGSQPTESTLAPSLSAAPGIREVDDNDFDHEQHTECGLQPHCESLSVGGCFQQSSGPPGDSSLACQTATPDSIQVPSLGSTLSDASLSPPATPTGVVYGEARVIKMRVSRTEGDLTRTRSLDDLSLYGKKARSTDSLASKRFPTKRNLGSIGRPYSSIGLQNIDGSLRPQSGFSAATEGTVLRASKTLVRRSPTVLNRIRQLARSNYVDRGTNAENPGSAITADLDAIQGRQFVPVFPLLEDLVVHFTNDGLAELLDYAVQAYKDGVYPLTHLSTPSIDVKGPGTSLAPGNTGKASPPPQDSSVKVNQALHERVSAQNDASEYDPFASHGSYGNLTPSSSQNGISLYSQTEKTGRQTTSSQTPPPTPPEPASKFHQFSIVGHGTAVGIQNALRCVLAVYFPCKEQGYHRYAFLLYSEMDDPWKPAFGEQPPRRGANRTDLVLAIGAQQGVKRDYFLGVAKQVEKLGEKPSGYTRSGRLDLRYLLARVMNEFTRQALAKQAVGHPFRDLKLLVAWLIPQLEIWLHANMSVRFLLLEYTPEHLSTVLALRDFIGDHMFKVAGIIDTTDSFPRYPKRPDSPSDSKKALAKTNPALNPNAAFLNPSFSKANYLLTCSATESEATVFIHSIWKHLIRGSQFYIPQGPAYPRSPKAKTPSPPPPLPSQASSIIKQYSSSSYDTSVASSAGTGAGIASPPLSPVVPQYTHQQQQQQRPPSPTASITSRISAAETVRTARTGRSMFSAKGGRRGRTDAQSMLTVDLEDDGDLVPDERRLMPRFDQQGERPKPSSKKALKMLGLA